MHCSRARDGGATALAGSGMAAVVIGLAVYLAVRAGPGSPRRDGDGARSELDRRFVAGEIDVDEHQRRAEALQR